MPMPRRAFFSMGQDLRIFSFSKLWHKSVPENFPTYFKTGKRCICHVPAGS